MRILVQLPAVQVECERMTLGGQNFLVFNEEEFTSTFGPLAMAKDSQVAATAGETGGMMAGTSGVIGGIGLGRPVAFRGTSGAAGTPVAAVLNSSTAAPAARSGQAEVARGVNLIVKAMNADDLVKDSRRIAASLKRAVADGLGVAGEKSARKPMSATAGVIGENLAATVGDIGGTVAATDKPERSVAELIRCTLRLLKRATVSEIMRDFAASELTVQKNTVYSTLHTMKSRGEVIHSESGHYRMAD
jgi:hypothetical protein